MEAEDTERPTYHKSAESHVENDGFLGARWKLREFKVRLFDNISKFGSGGPDLSLLNLV